MASRIDVDIGGTFTDLIYFKTSAGRSWSVMPLKQAAIRGLGVGALRRYIQRQRLRWSESI